MKCSYLFGFILLPGLVWGAEIVVNPKIISELPIHGILPTSNDGYSEIQMKSPPPTNSIHYVVDTLGYGRAFSCPNADHIVRRLGAYDVPYIFAQSSADICLYYWDDSFGLWRQEIVMSDAGGICAAADTFGNIHAVWHGPIPPTDVYEIWYRKKTGGTWGSVILVSEDEGVQDGFPVVTVDGDDNVTAVWNHGDVGLQEDLDARRSTDGGTTWGSIENITNFGGIMFGSWILASIDCDLGTHDVHVVCNTDMNSDNWMDIYYVHYDAAGGSWDSVETVAFATVGRHPLACAQVVVDSDNVPHVVYQENLSDQGGADGLSGWSQCGPAGMSWYTYKAGGSWMAPQAIFSSSTGWATGYSDLGIDENNCLYLMFTQPAYSDGDAFYYGFPWASFNVYYSVKFPRSAQWAPREMVSRVWDPYVDTSCIYPQTNKNIPSDGPDVAWCQLVGQVPPSAICYNHETPGLPPAGDVALEWVWPDSKDSIEVGDTVYPKAVFRCVSWEKQRTDYFMDSRFEFWWHDDSLLFDYQRPVPDIPPGSLSDTIESGFGIIITDSTLLDALVIMVCAIKANDTDPSNDCGLVGIEEEYVQPMSHSLYLLQNRPNPFTRSTSIGFSIPAEGKVMIEIFDAAGRLVRRLIDRRLTDGFHSIKWDGSDNTQKPVPGGIYFYRLKTSRKNLTRKMIYLK